MSQNTLNNTKFSDNPLWMGGVEIIRILQDRGHRAYFVGGCVRDVLFGGEPDDFDIATSCNPDESLKYFPDAGRIGIRYGVLNIKRKGFDYQLATFRRDAQYSDGRRPDRIFFSDIHDDAKRRDFTINAVYLDPVKSQFIDPVGGISDIEKKILRVIGDPVKRFREDHLRLLRAIRFAARFELEIDETSFAAMVECASLVEKISPHRIRDEIHRSFKEGNINLTVKLLCESDIVFKLLPELREMNCSFFESLSGENENTNNVTDDVYGWSLLFAPLVTCAGVDSELTKAAMNRFNFSRKTRRKIFEYIKNRQPHAAI